jgi:chitodextrinase
MGRWRPRFTLISFLAVVAAAGGVTVPASAAPVVTAEGRLVSVHGDDVARRRPHFSLFLETSRGRVRLHVGGSDHALPTGAVVRVRGTRLGDGSLAVAAGTAGQGVEVVKAAKAATGTKNVAVLMINFTNDASKPYTADTVRGVMFTNPNSIAEYFSEQSYGKLTVTGNVFGWYAIPYDNSGCLYSTWASAARSAATAAGVNLAGYTNIVYVFPRTTSCGWAGLAYMPGSDSFANGYMQLSVEGHELSHNFGVHHANSYRCTSGSTPVFVSGTCTSTEYGDPFSIMGGAQTRHSVNWHLGQMGWFGAGDTVTATASGTYTIGAAELSSSVPKAVRVARSGGKYFYLEYRRPFGTSFDNFTSSDPAVNGVTIRLAPDYPTITQSQLLDTTPSTSSFTDAPLAVGKSVTDPDTGTTFTTQTVSSTAATVAISLSGGDTSPPTVPGNLTATSVLANSVSLSWSPSTDNVGVTGYRVKRGGVDIGSTASTSFTDGTVSPGTTYLYSVVAYDAAGNVGPGSGLTVTTPSGGDTVAPSSPTGVAATRTRPRTVALSWQASTDNIGVAGYRVYRDGTLMTTTTVLSYEARAPRRAVTYYVVAFDAAGNVSPPSNSVTV